jgi:hypothetical protein
MVILYRALPKEASMRRTFIALALSLSLWGTGSLGSQNTASQGIFRTSPALEQFKALAGEWEGKDSRGRAVHANYEVLDTGVIMERVQPDGEPGMLTMYSLDGDHIVAIHFCSAGNQPILRTGTLAGATGKYDFALERTYGMHHPEELHMVGLLVTLTDKDHFSQAWTSVNHGKRATHTLTFARKKS